MRRDLKKKLMKFWRQKMKPNYWEKYKAMYGENSMIYKFHSWLNKKRKNQNEKPKRKTKN